MSASSVSGSGEAPAATGRTPPTPVEAGRHGDYEHLAPLFAQYAALPVGHAERERLRRELIAGHLPVARHIALKYSYRGEHTQDLEQVASLGLILALDRFDPGRDVHFLSFAVPTITGEVLRYFRDRVSTIRVPRGLRTLQGQIREVADRLAQRHGRAPRPSEIARELGVDVDVVLDGLASHSAGHTSSLDEPAGQDEDRGGPDRGRFAAVLGRPDPEFDLIEYREALAPLLAELPERERRILLLRFFGGQTQTEIAAQVGISQMHVSRLLTRTLADLRCRLTAE